MGRNKRIEWVDTVKFICIIFVMLSHLETRTEFWKAFYHPFFLTAFFFVSGYVYRPGRQFSVFLYKKFRQLFMPWLAFSVLNILLSQIISFNEHNSLINELAWNFLQVRGEGDGVWFVACLFVAFIPFYFFIEWYESKAVGGIALIIAFALSLISTVYTAVMPPDILPWGSASLPWHMEYIFQAMFFMVLGYVFRRKIEEKFDRVNNVYLRICACVIYLTMAYVPYIFDIKLQNAADILFSYVNQLLGVICIIAISKKIKSNKYIRYIGGNTLICFALHGKVYSVLETLLEKLLPRMYMNIIENLVASSVFSFVLTLLISVILIIPIYVINRWFPYVVGKSKSLGEVCRT